MKSDLVRGDYERARRKSFVRAIASWLGRSDNYLRARLRDEGLNPSDLGQLSYIATAPSAEDSDQEAGFDEALGERIA